MIGWHVSGGADLAKALEALPDGVDKRTVTGALKQAGEPIRAKTAQRAPRGPEAPHLADNIGMSVVTDRNVRRGGRDPKSDFAIKIGPTRDYYYGYFYEFGTVRQPARPFLRPVFDSEARPASGRIQTELWNAIRKKAGTLSGRTSGMGGRFL